MTPDIKWHPISEMTDEIRNSGKEVLFTGYKREDGNPKNVIQLEHLNADKWFMEDYRIGATYHFVESDYTHFAVLNTPEESQYSVMVEIPETEEYGDCSFGCPLFLVNEDEDENEIEEYGCYMSFMVGGMPGKSCPRYKESI